ncbi:MAG: glycosyltransferase [Desulfuromonadaceae bacterium]
MRIALISPYSIGPIRGNITTIERISRFLRRAGADVLVLPADTISAAEMERQLVSFSPHLIHGFHAHYCGGIAQHLAETFNLPLMLTITGSDLHDPLLRDHFVTVRAIEAAQSVVCFGVGEAAKLVSYFPHINERVAVISQGVEVLPVAATDTFGIPDDAFVLLLPAAVRPVKQVEFPLLALKSLVHTFPLLRLVLAGGVIDHDYAATIRNMLCDTPYATWLGEVPREQMGALYTRANVVLNCSYSESMSNTVLEAMALGRPLLVNDIPGNRMLINHRDTGLLYKDQDSFLKGVVTLMEDADLRTNLGRRAGEYIHESFSPQHEAAEYIRLYHSLIPKDHDSASL